MAQLRMTVADADADTVMNRAIRLPDTAARSVHQ